MTAGVGRRKVGELARETGLTVRTLHHYDQLGLLDGEEDLADLLRRQLVMADERVRLT